MKNNNYELIKGDCIIEMQKLKDKDIQFDLSIYSPPFSSLYAYNSNIADMGNSKESDDEFKLHFRFFAKAIFPLIKDGRNMIVHVQNPVRSKQHHGYMGIYDLRGDMIRIFERAGFIYYGEITINKNPQAQAIRTKAHALTFTQFIKDSTKSRPALADYILIFKKPGDNKIQCTDKTKINQYNAKERLDIPNDDWIEWAAPIWFTQYDCFDLPYPYKAWMDIRETNTLNTTMARSEQDEKHICALQLDLIDRCVKLWSNKNEIIFDPFVGIGSVIYQAILNDRRGFGIELKDEYYEQSIKNCNEAIEIKKFEKSQTEMEI